MLLIFSVFPYIFAAPAGADPSCYHNFLGLLPWYNYLVIQRVNGTCDIGNNFILLGSHSSILLILLAVVEDLLRLAGLFAVIYFIYAGVKYVMSQGSPDEVGKAHNSIRNAVTGLVIALIAIPLTSYLANQFSNGNAGTSKRVGGLDLSTLPNPAGIDNGLIIPTLLTIVFSTLGGLAVLFVVIGGYNYVMSQGDAGKVQKARQTILYALIGLAVAITAQSLVSFVVGKV